MKEQIAYVAMYAVLILVCWFAGMFVSDSMSDYEIIQPKQGVECVVVSRMFNTSVDCNWSDK